MWRPSRFSEFTDMSTKIVALRPLERSLLKSLRKITSMLGEEASEQGEAPQKAPRERRTRVRAKRAA